MDLVSVDFKSAYYSVSIRKSDRKYLRFIYRYCYFLTNYRLSSNNFVKISKTVIVNTFENILENGDRVLESAMNSFFDFNKLIEHKTIYKSYVTSRHKLLKID